MNKIGELINVPEITKGCRELNVHELMVTLRWDVMKFWSWGSHAFTVDAKPNTRMFRFTVNGHHHKGYVYICVNGLDLYDVYLTSNRGTIKLIGEGLYCDMLTDWIDTKVERISDYAR